MLIFCSPFLHRKGKIPIIFLEEPRGEQFHKLTSENFRGFWVYLLNIHHLTNTYWPPTMCQIHYSKIPVMSKKRCSVLCDGVYSLVISRSIPNQMTLKFIYPRPLHWVPKLHVQLSTQYFYLNTTWKSICPRLNLWTWIYGHSPLSFNQEK